jgi:hypothetical protein
VTADERKKALFLLFAGRKVYQIFDKLNATPRGADAANNIPAKTAQPKI